MASRILHFGRIFVGCVGLAIVLLSAVGAAYGVPKASLILIRSETVSGDETMVASSLLGTGLIYAIGAALFGLSVCQWSGFLVRVTRVLAAATIIITLLGFLVAAIVLPLVGRAH